MSEVPQNKVKINPFGHGEIDQVLTGVPAIDYQDSSVTRSVTIERAGVLEKVLLSRCSLEIRAQAACQTKHPLRWLGPLICAKEVEDVDQCRFNLSYEMAMEQKRRRMASDAAIKE